MTSEHSHQSLFPIGELTQSLVDSPAKTLATPEKEQDSAESEADYSMNLSAPFARWDQESLCWRTWQLCLLEGLTRYSERWPRSGLMLNGIVYRQQPLVPRTKETECLSLPTLGKNEGKGSSRNRYLGSPHFRGSKASEGLRTCETDPIYLHPCFAELLMGFPIGWTDLED